MSKKWVIILLSFYLSFLPTLKITCFAIDDSLLTIEAPNLPNFDDQTFQAGRIRIETFGREGCPYCEILKNNLYSSLDFSSSDDSIVARYYNLDHDSVKTYFGEWEERFNLPENLKGAIPATIINGTYLILGYDENSTVKYLDLIEQINQGNVVDESPENYLFVINSPESSSSLFFPLDSTTDSFNWSLIVLTSCFALGLIISTLYYLYLKKAST